MKRKTLLIAAGFVLLAVIILAVYKYAKTNGILQKIYAHR